MISYITWAPDPEIFRIGSLAIRWYGLLFALGFVTGYFIIQSFFKKENIPVKLLDQLTTVMVVATIIGARLGHCLFYEPDYYLKNPVDILKIWEGGLASHGAAIAIIIGIWFFARRNKLSFWWVIDRIAVVTALAGFFIRMGNLANSEIFGKPTTLPWGFIFVNASDVSQSTQPRHPSQIYEGFAYLLTFLLLMVIYYRKNGKPREGLLISLFMILVFSTRFLIEFLKEPQVDFETQMLLNMGQLLSIPFILAGLAGVYLVYRKKGD
ncbi:MAG: prolipoprotein diacylglyceryl transferase [Bacteroidales bacterium]|nr:prolipoprotein diacylglyceryl transferase [Bacteroidales bacterium]